MKSINVIVSVIIAAILAIPSIAFAAGVGSPASPDSPKGPGVFSLKQSKNLDIKVGGDIDLLFGRDIKGNGTSVSGAKITSGQWYMGKISCTLFNRFSPYVELGTARLKAKWTENGQDVKLESDTNFAWGLGGKFLIWDFQKPKIKLITDGLYRASELDAEKGTAGGSSINNLDKSKSFAMLREWQIALIAAGEFDVTGGKSEEVLGVSTILPYAGIKYSDISGRFKLEQSTGNFYNPGKIKSDRNVGIVFGCDFVGPNSVSLNLEGRLIDEEAFTGGLTVLF
ncbi:MAG: hypothetical protein NTV07_06660 [Candidatus Omnitrophica bacterium]|nr:hypothetical protein [Candidatus Omnitrophota bacterium]